MKNNTPRKTINVDKPNLKTLWNFKDSDDAVLNLSLFKESVPFDITGQTIRLGAKTNAGLKEQIEGFTIQGNNLDIALKNTILVPGIVEIDLEFIDAEGKMTSASFFINVNSKVLNDNAVVATNEFDSLTKAVEEIQGDYQGLRKIVIDENNAANLQDQVDNVNAHLAEKANDNESVKTLVGKKGIMYAGVIRNDGTGWKYIDDVIHNNINFTTIATNEKNQIVVYNTRAKKIGSMVVVPDETLASYGLICGASVGDTASFIECYAPFTGYISGAGAVVANDWFNGAYTVVPLVDGTGFTINYDGGGNSKDKVVINNVRDSGTTHYGLDIRSARATSKQVELRAYHDLYGYIYYDGSAWQVSSSCIANISCSFDNATGVLTINHDGMGGGTGYHEYQSVSVTPRKGSSSTALIHPRINSVSHSQVKIEFYDTNGTLITTPTNNMRIFFSRPGFRVPHTWNSGTRVYFDFGYSLVRAGNLVSTTGNLWLLGLHQAL